jgi:hypothetical protein
MVSRPADVGLSAVAAAGAVLAVPATAELVAAGDWVPACPGGPEDPAVPEAAVAGPCGPLLHAASRMAAAAAAAVFLIPFMSFLPISRR